VDGLRDMRLAEALARTHRAASLGAPAGVP
jgi:hypothetical protein